jgi:hypothetical protein
MNTRKLGATIGTVAALALEKTIVYPRDMAE